MISKKHNEALEVVQTLVSKDHTDHMSVTDIADLAARVITRSSSEAEPSMGAMKLKAKLEKEIEQSPSQEFAKAFLVAKEQALAQVDSSVDVPLVDNKTSKILDDIQKQKSAADATAATLKAEKDQLIQDLEKRLNATDAALKKAAKDYQELLPLLEKGESYCSGTGNSTGRIKSNGYRY